MAPTALEKLIYDRESIDSELDFIQWDIDATTADPPVLLTEVIINHNLENLQTQSTKLRELVTKMHNLAPADLADQKSILQSIDRKIKTLMNALHGIKSNLPIRNPVSQTSTSTHSTRLPKLEIKPFDGNLVEWTSFKDMFISAIHSKANIPKVEKFTYLKTYLRGEPERILQNMVLTDDNYDIAWKQLQDRYQNDREILFSILRRFFSQGPVQPTPTALRALVDIARDCDRSLETLSGTAIPTINELYEFIEKRARGLAAGCTSNQRQQRPQGDQRRVHAHHGQDATSCRSCNGSPHPLYQCKQFISSSVQQRYEILSKLNHCYNCLRDGHSSAKCSSTGRCKHCQGKHHSLLHNDSTQRQNGTKSTATNGGNSIPNSIPSSSSNNKEQPVRKPTNDGTVQVYHSHQPQSCQGMLATAIINVVGVDDRSYPCRAFLDGGSTVSFISEDCITRLGLRRSKSTATIVGIAASSVGTTRGVTTITFSSHIDPASSFSVSPFILSKVTANLPSHRHLPDNSPHLNGLRLADPQWNKPAPIDILLGSDIFWTLTKQNRIFGPANLPFALDSLLGWLVVGQSPSNSIPIQAYHTDVELDKQLAAFWELEDIPTQRLFTPEEEQCEKHFTSTHTIDASGRFSVCLPFRNSQINLGQSRTLALNRLHSLERRLSRNTNHLKEYISFMREYQSLGHMSLVTSSLPVGSNTPYFIPHHFVLKEDSTTTKFRVVFDASAKPFGGNSLNQSLLVGPTLQDPLWDIMLRFRVHPIAFTADIAKMYRQIRVAKDDTIYQHILWRESPDHPINEYKLETVTYGTAPAPYLAVKCLQQLATNHSQDLPFGAAAALNDFYVDDLMSSSPTLDSAIKSYKELIQLCNLGGFPLRKWSSNSKELLGMIPAELKETTTLLDMSLDPSVKTLGIRWNTQSDCFEFRYHPSNLSNISHCTKRQILSEMSKLFDPIGWLSPIVIRSKILMQGLWKLDASWDDPLPQSVQDHWRDLQEDMKLISLIKIPRCIAPIKSATITLSGFGDASEKAYAAVVYLCVETQEQNYVSLIASKTRVAPVQVVSIPRLELCASVLLVKLINSVHNALNLNFSHIYAYSDSTDVLGWIKSHPTKWKTFVANRVSKIQSSKVKVQWGFVKGTENPADCASRGLSAAALSKFSLWWTGPMWLTNKMSHESRSQEVDVEPSAEFHVEEKKSHSEEILSHSSTVEDSLLSIKSNINDVCRITAWILRFINNCQKGNMKNTGSLTPKELKDAIIPWIRITQQQCLKTEHSTLLSNSSLPKKSSLSNLNPFLDPHGLIRVGGRLRNSQLPSTQKNPIVLPRHSRLTELIISHLHVKYLHAGPTLLQSLIQQQYWIIRCRDAVRFHIHKCITCVKTKPSCESQMMADFPSSRVTPVPVFQTCGVDYAGPFHLKPDQSRSKTTYKAYLALFVCFVTRAFHLEVVKSLSTEAFIATLRRFVSRRGLPSDIYSDCGTNFVGAKKELHELQQLVRSEVHNNVIVSTLSNDGIRWHFNPPGAPHFGGLWEAGVKSVKFHLDRILGSTRQTYEEFSTTICQIEACLNSRPLTAMTSDPSDLEPLTSGHFLINRPLLSVPDPDLSHLKENRLSTWQRIQRLQQSFWKRWSNEYVTRLQQRPKWLQQRADLKINDLVIIKEENIPPQQWRLGRVQTLHPGQDGLVRVVTLFTKNGLVKRPIAKLCLLPIFNDSVEDSNQDVL